MMSKYIKVWSLQSKHKRQIQIINSKDKEPAKQNIPMHIPLEVLGKIC